MNGSCHTCFPLDSGLFYTTLFIFTGLYYWSLLTSTGLFYKVSFRIHTSCHKYTPLNGVLQCVAACCSVLQCDSVCCSALQCVAVRCSVLQCVAVCCSVLQRDAVCCRVLQCVAVCCSVLIIRWMHAGEATLTVFDSNVYANQHEWNDKFRPKVFKQRNTGF